MKNFDTKYLGLAILGVALILVGIIQPGMSLLVVIGICSIVVGFSFGAGAKKLKSPDKTIDEEKQKDSTRIGEE